MVSSRIQISQVVCSIPRVTRKKNVWDFCLRAQSGYAHFIKFYNSAIKLGLVRTRDTFTFVKIHGRENEAKKAREALRERLKKMERERNGIKETGKVSHKEVKEEERKLSQKSEFSSTETD